METPDLLRISIGHVCFSLLKSMPVGQEACKTLPSPCFLFFPSNVCYSEFLTVASVASTAKLDSSHTSAAPTAAAGP